MLFMSESEELVGGYFQELVSPFLGSSSSGDRQWETEGRGELSCEQEPKQVKEQRETRKARSVPGVCQLNLSAIAKGHVIVQVHKGTEIETT